VSFTVKIKFSMISFLGLDR